MKITGILKLLILQKWFKNNVAWVVKFWKVYLIFIDIIKNGLFFLKYNLATGKMSYKMELLSRISFLRIYSKETGVHVWRPEG